MGAVMRASFLLYEIGFVSQWDMKRSCRLGLIEAMKWTEPKLFTALDIQLNK